MESAIWKPTGKKGERRNEWELNDSEIGERNKKRIDKKTQRTNT